MTARLSLAAAIAALGIAADTASAAPQALSRCGTITVAGAKWQVGAAGVPCARAVAIVRKLGARPTPTPPNLRYPGTYLGMRCLGGKAANGVRAIDCLGANGRHSVVAAAKS